MKFIYVFLLFSLSSFIFAEAKAISSDRVDKSKNFIEEVESADPEVQRMLEQLREDYANQRDQVNKKYDDKKKRLKDQRKQEMDQLKKSFRSRLEKIKNRYPNKLKEKKRIKPLAKDNILKDRKPSSPNKRTEIKPRKSYKEKNNISRTKNKHSNSREIKDNTIKSRSYPEKKKTDADIKKEVPLKKTKKVKKASK